MRPRQTGRSSTKDVQVLRTAFPYVFKTNLGTYLLLYSTYSVHAMSDALAAVRHIRVADIKDNSAPSMRSNSQTGCLVTVPLPSALLDGHKVA